MATVQSRVPKILKDNAKDLLSGWSALLVDGRGDRRISESELTQQMHEFLTLMQAAFASEGTDDLENQGWTSVRDFLARISKSRALQGFRADETATFVFSFKRPLFDLLRKELDRDPALLAAETWSVSDLLDKLGLQTVAAFQRSREEIINRQQEELLELSTPVVKLWDGILALPMIGTLDSTRTQVVMESLLQKIVDTGSEIAIIDITGVPTVDTQTAQHLLKTASAIRMLGADCIISGIRPQIAQTIVHLGVELGGVTTKATLADALALALKRIGLTVIKKQG